MPLAGLTGCDQGKPHDQVTVGPPVHLVTANVGKDANGKDQPFPTDGVLRLAFDRLLLPLTVTRQTVVLRDASGNPASVPIVDYDPVARTVSISNPDPTNPDPTKCWLLAKQPYTIRLGIPSGADDDLGGIRAIDRATLDPTQPLEIGFMTSATPCGGTVPPPQMNFCVDVLPMFQSKCSAPQCHGSPQNIGAKSATFPDGYSRPAMGLVLDNSVGFQATAVGRVAEGSNTGARAGLGSPPSHLFGVDMPIVDPGDPGNSWLLYKLLLAPPPTYGDGGDPNVPPTTCAGVTTAGPFPIKIAVPPLSDDERARLSDYVLGREMPYPTLPGSGDPAPVTETTDNPPLSFDELEKVRAWILGMVGSGVVDCSACTGAPIGDAGGPPPADAGGDAPTDAPKG